MEEVPSAVRPQIFGRTIIKVGIKFMNDATIFLIGIQTNLVGSLAGQVEDVETSYDIQGGDHGMEVASSKQGGVGGSGFGHLFLFFGFL